MGTQCQNHQALSKFLCGGPDSHSEQTKLTLDDSDHTKLFSGSHKKDSALELNETASAFCRVRGMNVVHHRHEVKVEVEQMLTFDPDFACPICHVFVVGQDPKLLSCCAKLFCGDCLSEWF